MLIDKCTRIIHILFLAVAIWVSIIIFATSVKKYTLFIIAAVLLIYIGYYFLRGKMGTLINIHQFLKVEKYFFYILLLLAFIFMIIIAFALRVDVYGTWDYGQLIRTAYEYVTEGQFSNTEYYARYPNNSFYLLVLSLYFKLIHPLAGENIYNYINATIPVNCILVMSSIIFCYIAAREFVNERAALKCGFIMLGMSPLYLYATIAYTDVFAIFPVSLLLFSYAKIKSEQIILKKMLWLCLAALLTAVGYKIKATLIIFFIAIVMDLFFAILKKNEKITLLIVYISVFCISVSICTTISKNFLYHNGVTQEMMLQEEFPVTHWLMMSLNPQHDGGFNQEDVDYTKSHLGKEEKTDANINLIKERVADMGIVGTMEHIFVKKVIRMWGAGDCSASDYVSRQPLSENIIREFFALNGQYNYIYRICAQIYYILVILAVLKVAIIVVVRKKMFIKSFMLELVFLGVFMFFLIWECNSRYLFVFLPVLALLISITEERGKRNAR